MRQPNTRNWSGESTAKHITDEATPPATLGLLVMADQYPVDVATMPYAACGRVFDGIQDAAHATRYLGVVVGPGSVHGRGIISRSFYPFGPNAGANNTSWTDTGGNAGAGVVTTFDPTSTLTADQIANGNGIFYTYGFGSCPVIGGILLIPTGATINDAPVSSVDRQYELAKHGYPYVEPMMVTYAAGFAVYVSQRVGNLETL